MKSPSINLYTPPSTLSFLSEKDLFPESQIEDHFYSCSPTSFTQIANQFNSNLSDDFSHLINPVESTQEYFQFDPFEIPIMDALQDLPTFTPPLQVPSQKKQKSTTQESGREFYVEFKDPSLGEDFSLSVTMKALRGKPSTLVPDILYSSLKYDIMLEAKGAFVQSQPMLMARLSVVDPSLQNKLLNVEGKAPINGEIEGALTHPPSGVSKVIKGCLKNVQFDSSISFNFVKKELSLCLSLFLHDNLVKPVYAIYSYPVKFFARKPNKKKPKTNEKPPSTSKKRKREETSEEELEPVAKESKSNFEEFTRRLNELFDCGQKLSPEDKRNAATLVMEKFGMSDTMTSLFDHNGRMIL